ncbi:AvrE-family type 3 secretion system effector [Pseudomonas sp. LP_7_YM]|uniref:AvrE-family type 3 secretion system effector n=1 Tax=Pseudomonas sp. LP_7_YM TaxID=2485137 RepID=UPI0010EBE61C|nr:AvrE-family type 3 secretion system effector [Pseudomonas sp. LP_7_YM]TDV67673.1 pathogenicity factor AvrE [Pseudomonas sp. LP_7_YM]
MDLPRLNPATRIAPTSPTLTAITGGPAQRRHSRKPGANGWPPLKTLRIKAIAVFRTATKEDSLGLPLPYVSFKSGSALSIERLRGEVTFDYGLDQSHPKKFTVDGELGDAADQQSALQAAHDLGSHAGGEFRTR